MDAKRHEPLVAPRYEREEGCVEGAFYVVRDQCTACALPPETAPDNITWDEAFEASGCEGCPNHCRVSKQPQTDEELDLMIEAAWGSCVEAIRYRGTDEFTLNRFKELGVARICDALPADEPTFQEKLSVEKPWWKFW